MSHPLTRLEITLDPETPYDKVPWPSVYVLDDLQMCFDEAKATDTERFILNALLQGVGSLNDLGRKTRAKIESLMSLYVKFIKISEADYTTMLNQLRSFTTKADPSAATDPDQPPKPPAPSLPDWVQKAMAADSYDEMPP